MKLHEFEATIRLPLALTFIKTTKTLFLQRLGSRPSLEAL